jgi:hypothetical protein
LLINGWIKEGEMILTRGWLKIAPVFCDCYKKEEKKNDNLLRLKNNVNIPYKKIKR